MLLTLLLTALTATSGEDTHTHTHTTVWPSSLQVIVSQKHKLAMGIRSNSMTCYKIMRRIKQLSTDKKLYKIRCMLCYI